MDGGRSCLWPPPDARCPLREGSVADSRRASENALRLDGSPAPAAILALSSSPAEASSGDHRQDLPPDFKVEKSMIGLFCWYWYLFWSVHIVRFCLLIMNCRNLHKSRKFETTILSYMKSASRPGLQFPEDASAGLEEPANQRRSPLEEDNAHLEETACRGCWRTRMFYFQTYPK